MSSKQVVIDMSESIKSGTGKDAEQWLFRLLVLYCLFGEQAVSLSGVM
jgi:hypothetical protein